VAHDDVMHVSLEGVGVPICKVKHKTDTVMLSLKTLSCLKTVLRLFLRCLGLVSFVLEFTEIATKEGVPKTT